MNFREYAEEWKEVSRLNTSDGWKITQNQMLGDHIFPIKVRDELRRFEELPIEQITPIDVSRIINHSKKAGHSGNTTKQIYLLLSKMFNDAVQFFEYIKESPIRKKYHAPKVETKEQRFLRVAQTETLLFHAKNHWAKEAVYIQLFVGLRVSEVIALRWKDIDFDRQCIFIRSAYKRKIKMIEEFPKNGKQIWVPLKGRLLSFLKEIQRERKPRPGDFVCRSHGGQMLSYQAYQKTLKILCARAGVTSISSHGLRHSCSHMWRTKGKATREDIQELFNHKSISSTETYIHEPEQKISEVAILAMG